MGVKKFRIPGICVALLVGLGLGLEARAGTWLLANGDRLTGELVGEDPQFIEVQHPQLGRLKVPRTALRAPDAAVSPAAVAAKAPAATPAVAAEAKADLKPQPAHNWKRQFELGYAQQSGAKEKQDLSIRMQLDGRKGENTFRATGRLLRSEADGVVGTDRREGDFRWRYDIDKRLFAQTLTTYVEDNVRQIDLSMEQQFGGGYRIVDTERHKVNVGLGAVVQYLQRRTTEDQRALLGSFFQDYAYQWNSHFKLVQESSFMVSNTGALSIHGGLGTPATTPEGSYRVKFNTGLQSKVTDHMSLNMRFEYDYDRAVIEPELRTDQRLTTSLGYLW